MKQSTDAVTRWSPRLTVRIITKVKQLILAPTWFGLF